MHSSTTQTSPPRPDEVGFGTNVTPRNSRAVIQEMFMNSRSLTLVIALLVVTHSHAQADDDDPVPYKDPLPVAKLTELMNAHNLWPLESLVTHAPLVRTERGTEIPLDNGQLRDWDSLLKCFRFIEQFSKDRERCPSTASIDD